MQPPKGDGKAKGKSEKYRDIQRFLQNYQNLQI
jgi:hypothetical protein